MPDRPDDPLPDWVVPRPPVEPPKQVCLQVPAVEADWWKVCASEMGVTVSGLIRYCVSHALVSKFDPPDAMDVPILQRNRRPRNTEYVRHLRLATLEPEE